MVKPLEDILLKLTAERQSKRARNRSIFLAYWPQIAELLAKGWALTDICEAMRIAGVEISYAVLRKNVAKRRAMEAEANGESPAPSPATSAIRNRKKEKKIPNDAQNVTVAPAQSDADSGVHISEPYVFGKSIYRDREFKF